MRVRGMVLPAVLVVLGIVLYVCAPPLDREDVLRDNLGDRGYPVRSLGVSHGSGGDVLQVTFTSASADSAGRLSDSGTVAQVAWRSSVPFDRLEVTAVGPGGPTAVTTATWSDLRLKALHGEPGGTGGEVVWWIVLSFGGFALVMAGLGLAGRQFRRPSAGSGAAGTRSTR